MGDHVFAKSFYPESLRGSGAAKRVAIFRCPCCLECQEQWHDSEQYLRMVIASSLDCCHHMHARELTQGPIARSLASGRGPAKEILASRRGITASRTEDGQIETIGEVTLDTARIQPAMKKILWGLGYIHYQELEGWRCPEWKCDCLATDIDARAFRSEEARFARLGAGYAAWDTRKTILHMICRDHSDENRMEALVAFYADEFCHRGFFFHIESASRRETGQVLQLKEDLKVDRGVIRRGHFVPLSRQKEYAELAPAGLDLRTKTWGPIEGSAARLNPSLLVKFDVL